MLLNYRWKKNDNGALHVDFVPLLARHFGIETFIETGTQAPNGIGRSGSSSQALTRQRTGSAQT